MALFELFYGNAFGGLCLLENGGNSGVPIKEINSCVPIEVEHGIVAESARHQSSRCQHLNNRITFPLQLLEVSFFYVKACKYDHTCEAFG